METRSKRASTSKGVRKHSRSTVKVTRQEDFTITEMFERFMWHKNGEGLSPRTIEEYELHFSWLMRYLGEDLSKEDITLKVFREWVDYMETEQGLAPMTVNIRIRTMRAFVRWCYLEKLIDEPIHEKFKPKKVAEDTIEALTITEIKSLLNAFDDSTFVGFRDKVFLAIN